MLIYIHIPHHFLWRCHRFCFISRQLNPSDWVQWRGRCRWLSVPGKWLGSARRLWWVCWTRHLGHGAVGVLGEGTEASCCWASDSSGVTFDERFRAAFADEESQQGNEESDGYGAANSDAGYGACGEGRGRFRGESVFKSKLLRSYYAHGGARRGIGGGTCERLGGSGNAGCYACYCRGID